MACPQLTFHSLPAIANGEFIEGLSAKRAINVLNPSAADRTRGTLDHVLPIASTYIILA